ncbi:MAG: peptide chain release factor aRF-1 [Candidatus Hadarchaeota archaeon]
MSTDVKSVYQFKRLLESLKDFRGRGTELITVYIPPDFDMAKVMQQLRDEQGTASNIKSKNTRKNVLGALERVIQFLRNYTETNRKPPPHGMAIFAGNVAGRDDYTDIQLYWVEPPEPITTRMYRCDQEFVLKPLEEMLEIKETIGLLLIDGKEATIGTLRGKHAEVVRKITSGAPGKHSKGGQSARRFERLHEIAVDEYKTRVGEAANNVFSQIPDLKVILVGGPGPMKEDFLKEGYLRDDIAKKVAGVFDTGYTDEQGIKELVNKSGEVIKDLGILKEKTIMQKFLEELVAGRGLAVYGEENVKRALELGAVDILLISESVRRSIVRTRCQSCGHEFQEIVADVAQHERVLSEQKCPSCGEARLSVVESKDVVRELLDLAEKFNTRAEFISTETDEGKQLQLAFSGVAAILRFRAGS